MSSFKIFDIAGSSLSAQSVRLNTVASNLANADSVTGDPNTVYRAKVPTFTVANDYTGVDTPGVKITGVMESDAPAGKRYEPGHPLADADGYIYSSNVNVVEQMVDMISASRSYQGSVDVMNTAKDLALRTLNLGK